MRWVWRAVGIAGLAVVALGLLWMTQAIGLIHIKPIACTGNCDPVEAPSLTWMAAGAATTLLGVATIGFARRGVRRHDKSPTHPEAPMGSDRGTTKHL